MAPTRVERRQRCVQRNFDVDGVMPTIRHFWLAFVSYLLRVMVLGRWHDVHRTWRTTTREAVSIASIDVAHDPVERIRFSLTDTIDNAHIPTSKPTEIGSVHGLIEVTGKQRKSLPFQLADGQKAWTCRCGSGWLSIGSDEPTEAYEQHRKG